MAKKGSKQREWTKTDIRELKTLARGKTPAGKIARALKRTEGATRQKAPGSFLGFSWLTARGWPIKSALPQSPDLGGAHRHFAFVPIADICSAANLEPTRSPHRQSQAILTEPQFRGHVRFAS